MNLLSRIIVMRKKAYLRGQKKQQKLDSIILQKTKDNYTTIINEMLNNQSKEIAIITEAKDREITTQADFYKKEIDRIIKNHEIAIASIRNQEKRHYEPIIVERNNEIARLNEEKNENRKYSKSILDYGIAMESSGERAAGLFSRAQAKVKEATEFASQSQAKFAEAMQLVDRGNACVETIQATVGKSTPRLLKNMNMKG
jgi:hypothetical protein